MRKKIEDPYITLRKWIIGGQYEPGTQLKEEHIGEELNVSRTPVRAALRKLAADGLVVIEANRGVFVARWSRWDLEEMFDLRVMMEPYAAKLAALRATDEDLENLQRINLEMANAITEKTADITERMQAANRAFHTHLLDCAKSQRLKSILSTLIDMPIITRSFTLYAQQDFERSLAQHQEITYAVQIRDPELAYSLMETHIRLSYRRFVQKRMEAAQE